MAQSVWRDLLRKFVALAKWGAKLVPFYVWSDAARLTELRSIHGIVATPCVEGAPSQQSLRRLVALYKKPDVVPVALGGREGI